MSTNCQFTTMVHVLTLLARASSPLSSTWIASSVNTNPVIVRQIIGQLRDAGLVQTCPGRAGGAILKREAAQITLGDVYGLVKRDTLFGLHPNEPNPHCPVGRNIQHVLVEVFGQLDQALADQLAEISIAEMVDRVSSREHTGCDRSIQNAQHGLD